MAGKAGTTRRSKKEITLDKIEKIDVKIKELNEKIQELTDEKESLKAHLREINAAENKAKEEEEFKQLKSLIKQKKISVADLRSMIESRESE